MFQFQQHSWRYLTLCHAILAGDHIIPHKLHSAKTGVQGVVWEWKRHHSPYNNHHMKLLKLLHNVALRDSMMPNKYSTKHVIAL